MQSSEYVRATQTCERCGKQDMVLPAIFHRNVSYIIRREEATSQGKFCFRCTTRLFFQFTGITLIGTWWGIIGSLVGPIYIVQNSFQYLKNCLGFLFKT